MKTQLQRAIPLGGLSKPETITFCCCLDYKINKNEKCEEIAKAKNNYIIGSYARKK